MKKIMVNAYTAFNLGDDLFVKILIDRYPTNEFFLYAPKKYGTCFKDNKNLSIIPNDSTLTKALNFISRRLGIANPVHRLVSKSCDGVVYVGGSLFMQSETWREGLKRVKNMKVNNKPFFLLGANFGPFEDKEFYYEYKQLFKEYHDICFRERFSYEMFSDLNNVREAADIVFQLKTKTVKPSKNNIVISVIKPSFRKYLSGYDDIYYEKIKDIVICFVQRGYNVTLMSFCESEGDKEAIETVFSLIPTGCLGYVNKYLYKDDIEEALEVIARSSFVIATRFHAMVLGWLYNKPVFPIVYSKKMTNVMEDVGFKGAYVEFKNIHSLESKDVFNSIKTNSIDVSKQVNDSKRHFEKLDRFLLD